MMGEGYVDTDHTNLSTTDRSEATGTTTRRRLLVAGASAATVLAAGCSDVTNQSFEAAAVTLPGEDQETLQLGEAAAETQTLNQEGPGDSEVTITNQVAVYSRENWLDSADGGE